MCESSLTLKLLAKISNARYNRCKKRKRIAKRKTVWRSLFKRAGTLICSIRNTSLWTISALIRKSKKLRRDSNSCPCIRKAKALQQENHSNLNWLILASRWLALLWLLGLQLTLVQQKLVQTLSSVESISSLRREEYHRISKIVNRHHSTCSTPFWRVVNSIKERIILNVTNRWLGIKSITKIWSLNEFSLIANTQWLSETTWNSHLSTKALNIV